MMFHLRVDSAGSFCLWKNLQKNHKKITKNTFKNNNTIYDVSPYSRQCKVLLFLEICSKTSKIIMKKSEKK